MQQRYNPFKPNAIMKESDRLGTNKLYCYHSFCELPLLEATILSFFLVLYFYCRCSSCYAYVIDIWDALMVTASF